MLTLSRVMGYALSFGRNIVLARMLTKADFGLSAAFATTVSLLELSGRFGLPFLVVQSPRGDCPRFLACLQAVQLLGGTVSALLLLALCQPMARLFGVPEATGSFAALALIPLINSLWHLDYAHSQRKLNFWPVALTEVIPHIVITLAVWPVTRWLPDHRSIVVLLFAKALLSLAVTHLWAERPFRLAWDRETAREIFRWAWPLGLSGLVLFASQQANQMVIGGAFSVSQLAGYAIAASLVSVPWFILVNVASALVLPVLVRSQSLAGLFERRLRLFLELSAVIAALLFVPLALCGEDLVRVLYGKAYVGCGTYMVILAAGVAFRLLGTAASLAALARADTRNELYGNLARCLSLPLALLAVWGGGDPATVAGCVLVGEVAGLVACLIRLRASITLSVKDMLLSVGYLCGFMAMAVALLGAGIQQSGMGIQLMVSAAVCAFALLTAAMLFPGLMQALTEFKAGVRRKAVPAAAG